MSIESLRSRYAKSIIRNNTLKKYRSQHDGAEDLPFWSVPTDDKWKSMSPTLPSGKVCIIGAGSAGLFIAMILRYLGFNDFDVFEASDRVGGRVYTYQFSEDPQNIAHNYYDIGAMRLPQIGAMKTVFNLITMLNLDDKKVPYNLNDPKHNEPNMFLYSPMSSAQIAGAMVPFGNAIRPFIDALEKDFDTGFLNIMKGDTDNYSTRAWLHFKQGWQYNDIETAETFDTSTGLFDQAFTETLLDYYDFNNVSQWWRIDGGMSVLTDAMKDYVASENSQTSGVNVSLNSQVLAMVDQKDKGTIAVTVDQSGTTKTQDYAAVFNTTTMGCLQQMDLSGLDLHQEVLTGIRSLGYDRSCKVAIMFSKPWWANLSPGVPDGGSSTCDLPIRTVVYPTWNDGSDKPAVLIASYTWAQDATRMGSLIPDYTKQAPNKSDAVVTLVLQNLAKLWSTVAGAPTFDQLEDMYMDHHAFAWSHDANTAGAFALFGPGQFKNVYPAFQIPQCENKFYMAGEATSAHHAWIVGALDSGYLAVWTWLEANGCNDALAALKASPFGSGEGQNVPELNETVLHWKTELAGLKPPKQVEAELTKQG